MTPPALLSAHPFAGIAATLAIYAAVWWLWRRLGEPALLHPILTAAALLGVGLMLGGIDYHAYFAQVAPMHHALAAVVVLLAVPLFRRLRMIRLAGVPLGVALLVGCLVAITTTVAAPLLAGAEPAVLATLAPKSVTTAVAVEISAALGGLTGITVVVVVATGIVGAAFGPWVLRLAGVDDHRAIGLALGVASHAIGTARAFQISETAGAFASIGMILNALLTMTVLPLVLLLA
jgi:putative effector of murein hydrolase